MRSHFIAKLTVGGGPFPNWELVMILEQANASGDSDAWFATRKSGAGWRRGNGRSICVILAAQDGRAPGIDAVVAEVVEKCERMPDNPDVRELYEDHEGFKAWWHLQNPIPVTFTSLSQIPGCSTASKGSASKSFGRSRLSFAYWAFSEKDIDSLHAAAGRLPDGRPDRTPADATGAKKAPALPRIEARRTTAAGLPAPTEDLHGVDYSGAMETERGNPKIWIASWYVRERCVSLQRGTDAGIRRQHLPGLVQKRSGWWTLDFPFGVAKDTARAIGIDPNVWGCWLRWCLAGTDPTERRDLARQQATRVGVPWSLRRDIDVENRTTWFPLFEQLYRQTITGAAEVLLPLLQMAREELSILPWHDRHSATVAVSEGFPGATIRRRINQEWWYGYKGNTPSHADKRRYIVNWLRHSGIPISDPDAQRAFDDPEGDAVDALVLLLASWIAHTLPQECWVAARNRLQEHNKLVEGWFPA